ncbi:hypothetical protein CRG98_008182 [Punica granatum]|uniref:Uncharacterized protein n=1 Tax=Punica granatum TaxID=22663 RepID=A0A2I0KSW1_PUNGR|nr:hypothetical protein CRG98_008182 [Punica granatum]
MSCRLSEGDLSPELYRFSQSPPDVFGSGFPLNRRLLHRNAAPSGCIFSESYGGWSQEVFCIVFTHEVLSYGPGKRKIGI